MKIPEQQNRAEHILILAKELLDDIELSRLETEPLLLKATRLARLIANAEIQAWLKFECGGYNSSDPLSLKYMSLTGRWTDRKNNLGYWGPLAQQELTVVTYKAQLGANQVPSISYAPSSANPSEFVTGFGNNKMKEVTDSISNKNQQIVNTIISVGAIRSKTISLLHDFVASVYYERLFSALSESIFENYKSDIDKQLSVIGESVLSKIPFVYDRLSEGEPEAISQGLTSCRRIIDAFADAVFPARAEPIQVDGKTFELTASHTKNRLNAYVSERVTSKSRRDRLRQTLTNLYDRVSAGVHSDVDSQEAKALLLQTYMYVGELTKLDSPVAES